MRGIWDFGHISPPTVGAIAMDLNGVSRMDKVEKIVPIHKVYLLKRLSALVGLHCDRRGPSLYTRQTWRPCKENERRGFIIHESMRVWRP